MTILRTFGPAVAVVAYVLTLVAFVGIDFIWLTSTSETLYKANLKDILLDGFRPAPAILFYFVYIVGLVWFAVRPAHLSGQLAAASGNGALFGFVAYGTYDLTNQATLKVWSTTAMPTWQVEHQTLQWSLLAKSRTPAAYERKV